MTVPSAGGMMLTERKTSADVVIATNWSPPANAANELRRGASFASISAFE